jgi:hypothetical protein
MKNNYENIKKIIEIFFKIDKISFANDNLNYLFDVALQIENKVPKEKYKKHFEELRLRNIYSELEPLTIFFTFLKNTLKTNTLEEVDKKIQPKLNYIITLISNTKTKLYDFKNLSTKEMVEFTNEFHKIFSLTFKGYKYHVKRFTEYEMIHDSKTI